MVDPSPLNLTISQWNQSLRRALHIHLPGCSACFYTCKGIITFFATTLVRKWPSQIHSHVFKPKSGPEIALDIAIHHACLSPVQKEALQLAFEMDVEMCALADNINSGWHNDIKEVQHHYLTTGNIVNHSLLKMDLCSMEKSSSSLQQKGRRSLVLCISHTKALPKHSCLPVLVSSGLVSTRPLKKLFCNVKHTSDFRPRMLVHHSHHHLHLHLPNRYVHQTFSHWMVWITSSLLISIPR